MSVLVLFAVIFAVANPSKMRQLLGSQSGEESTNQGDLEVGTAAASRTRPAADTEWSGIQTDRVNVNGLTCRLFNMRT